MGHRAQGPGQGRSHAAAMRSIEALGQMSSACHRAAKGIAELAENAVSESVKLAALRSIFSNMMAVSEFAESRRAYDSD